MSLHIMDTGSTSGLIQIIRDLVNEPLLHPTFYESPHFNRLCSAMDAIGDVEMIIRGYKNGEYCASLYAGRYLIVYGLLQSLFVQIDAVNSIAKAIGAMLPRNQLLLDVKEIRNLSIGHPTSYERENELFSFINRSSLTPFSFELYSYDATNRQHTQTVNMRDVLEKHEEGISDQLYIIYKYLLSQYAKIRNEDDIPRGVLTKFVDDTDSICTSIIPSLDRTKKIEENLPLIQKLKQCYKQFKESIDTLGKGELLNDDDKTIPSRLNWLERYLTAPNDPSFLETHRAHYEIKIVKDKFTRLRNIAERLEGVEESDDQIPWLDISLKMR